MKHILNKILLVAALAFGLTACDKDFEDDLVKDNRPEIPVTFAGSITYGFNPYYPLQLSGDQTIRINITIPENAPLKIKEVRKMVAGATGINAASLNSLENYLDAPLPVNGTSVTITTSLTEFNAYVPASARITSIPSSAQFSEGAFMFLLVMEDDSEIIPVQCRIRVTR